MGEKGTLPQGIQLLPDYISAEEECELVSQVDGGIWSNDLSRRVQHYGYRYDYRKRVVDPSMRLGSLPYWLQLLALRLHEDGIFAQTPDQVIVNEYMPGQGIAAHVDCEPCFGSVIASLSLCAPVPMVFGSRRTHEVAEVDLPPRSLLVLSGEGRYEWTHAILARKTDAIDGESRERARRVSLTFRTVIFNQPGS
ncbi:MAG: alpha-ketoglutarate-dependent dioxygenase AlkB [Fimbriimonadaceae bacterium]|nr:alpha-ketoglutarate-dependent dioxygenase AlkB [Fimbriimonadaceae bacterium]